MFVLKKILSIKFTKRAILKTKVKKERKKLWKKQTKNKKVLH